MHENKIKVAVIPAVLDVGSGNCMGRGMDHDSLTVQVIIGNYKSLTKPQRRWLSCVPKPNRPAKEKLGQELRSKVNPCLMRGILVTQK